MSISKPSKRVSVADIPEVSGFNAKFVYGFFTPDESTNDAGLGVIQADASSIDGITHHAPRFVRFTFTRVIVQNNPNGNEFASNSESAGQQNAISITDNLSQIQFESDFSSNEYLGLEFQDNSVDKKLFTLVSGSLAKQVSAKNRAVQAGIDRNRQTILDTLTDEHSLMDAARAMASETNENISNNVIVNALNQLDTLQLSFIDDATQQKLIDDAFVRVRDVSVRGQLLGRIAGRVIKNIVNDPMSTFSDELVASQYKALTAQANAISRHNPSIINSTEFEPTFRAITTKPIDAHDAPTSTKVIGYIIEKHEILSNGQLRRHPSIVIESPSVGIAVDDKVAYGRTYIYAIRTVAQLNVRLSVEDSDDIVIGAGLIASRRSTRAVVKCVESVPPPPPADFNIIWDYTHDALKLMWSFPPNPQRDIKAFQVFKRSSINEPFTLIQHIDFDDSEIKEKNHETPDVDVMKHFQSPVLTYLDGGFGRTSKAIYTLCSIDAHGLSSNYGMQFNVWFDETKNRVMKSLTSSSGAPKSYPNMYLNQDMFSDLMRTSGHTRCRVIFDPELLRLDDKRGNDMKLMTLNNVDGGKYQLQLTNVDMMQQEIVDITIDDARVNVSR